MRDTEKETELSALPNVVKLKLDISEPLQIQDVVEKFLSGEQVDVVFNNAGYLLAGPMEGITDEQLVSQITTNLLGPIRVTQVFIPHFREKKGGLFINTTSMSALIASPFMSVYSASKAGLEHWSFAMNLELGKFGIRVKTIIPGISKTNLLSNADKASSVPYTEFMNKVLSTFTGPEILTIAFTPEDIAKVVFEAATTPVVAGILLD
ncbi:MAG: SDR family NAD(P)-dependent oxidoreductase [Chitinophagaceae bacterium]|nr:SDR family NAD(P)-dependent oxidoreductase [Chitinophagaceae bacterium]